MTNTAASQTAPKTPAAFWDNPETIATFSGCRECARFQFGGGHSDPACVAHVAAHLRAAARGLKTIFATGDRERFNRAAKKALGLMRNHSTMNSIYFASLTMVYGPSGTHADWKDAEGRPTPAALAQCPRIGEAMANAAARVEVLLDCLARDIERELAARGVPPLTA